MSDSLNNSVVLLTGGLFVCLRMSATGAPL